MRTKFFSELERFIDECYDSRFDVKIIPGLNGIRFALVYEKESDDLMVFYENEEGKVRQMYFHTEVVEALRKML